MCLADRVLVYGDCAVIPDPTAEQLADIAISSAETAAQFGIEPRVAMLSYSTGSQRVRAPRSRRCGPRRRSWPSGAPDLALEGPIQYDAAVDPDVGRGPSCPTPTSPAGRRCSSSPTSTPATTPTRRCSAARTPSRSARCCRACASRSTTSPAGALVDDIVNTVAITAVQAQGTDEAAGRPTGERFHERSARPRPQRRVVVAEVPAGRARDRRGAGPRARRADRRVGQRASPTTPPRSRSMARAAAPTTASTSTRCRSRAVGHRVVHGGPDFSEPVVIDDAVLDRDP